MSATDTRHYSSRYNVDNYRMRGTDTTPSDLVERHSRKSFRTGRRYDFTRILWSDGSVTVRAQLADTTVTLHEWNSEKTAMSVTDHKGSQEHLSYAMPDGLCPTCPASVKPDHLQLAASFTGRGWKTFKVTGTRHAYYLLRKLAADPKFSQARLREPLRTPDGRYVKDNVLVFSTEDILGSDSTGKYSHLLNRGNTHYDLRKAN